jgi:phosphoribosylamine--glycine ligase
MSEERRVSELRVLVVGGGGREHALVWKIAESPQVSRVLAAPGSDAMREIADVFPEVSAGDLEAVVSLAETQRVDLVVVGPEDPLAAGLCDRLRAAGVACFGPSGAAAQLEASKAFAREFMARHDVPHPEFSRFSDLESARAYVSTRDACVVKADGLCAGKGVFVCDNRDEALAALDEIMGARRFGEAGAEVLVEERLTGEEASYYAITDGEHVVTLPAAQDHKRALDGDLGENTGGMGAYAPTPLVDAPTEKRILEEIVYPTLRGMRAEGHPYTGVLYVGLMIDASGAPKVIEYNVRFGDPETQPIMLALDADLVPYLMGSAHGALDGDTTLAQHGAALTVVLASGGYPRGYETGRAIRGLDAAGEDPDVMIFHAGTRRSGAGWETAGGRVLGVTARGDTTEQARERAYAAVSKLDFEGCHYRRDIAGRALGSS